MLCAVAVPWSWTKMAEKQAQLKDIWATPVKAKPSHSCNPTEHVSYSGQNAS
jgi:hypothetical protein